MQAQKEATVLDSREQNSWAGPGQGEKRGLLSQLINWEKRSWHIPDGAFEGMRKSKRKLKLKISTWVSLVPKELRGQTVIRPKAMEKVNKRVLLIISFFSNLLGETLIIIMNFSNYFNPFGLFPAFLHPIQYGFSPLNYLPPPNDQPEPTMPSSREIQTQTISKEIDRQKLVEKLQKFHYDETHHKKTHWTFEEDKLLQRLVENEKLEWKEIPRYFQGRTQNMCYSRYRRILMSTKERNWSKEEEDLVLDLISRYGEKWKLISSKMSKFTSKQIRQRYLNYLRPNINKEDFSYEEDLKICEFVIAHGNHWRQMEEILEGRPEGLIKGRYYGRLQKIIEECYVSRRN